MADSASRLNIAQIGSSLFDWGGIERYLLYLCDGLAGREHPVTAFVPTGSPLSTRLLSPQVPIALRRQFGFGRLPAFVRAFRDGGFDLAHVHFSPDFVVPTLAARLAKVPRIVMSRHVALPWSEAKVRRYLRLVDHIVPVSDAVRRVLAASGVPEARMSLALAGTPALVTSRGRSDVRAELGLGDQLAVGSFGRLVKEKGVDVLLMAARRAPEVSFHIFGSGPDEATLKALAPENVRFHGFVEGVADRMAAMDLVAIPSVWEEAFPYAALEALSLGVPVVASRVGGMPELVQDGVTGWLVPPRDPEALAERLRTLDAVQIREAGPAAKALHRAEFTVERFAERMEGVYTTLPAFR